MPSMSRRAGRALLASLVVILVAAGSVLAAGAIGYSGRTSQGQTVSFSISRGAVRNFKLVVHDKCPDGHTLSVNATYPAMTITRGSFGGAFAPVGGHAGERSRLQGTVGTSEVTGSVSDTSYSSRERRLCRGHTQFSARRR